MNQPSLELWGGIECTVNRVGQRYHDQLTFSGHARRPGDLAAIRSLGVKALRYPVLWEHAAPDSLDRIDLSWADPRLELLSEAQIQPIVGLLHHGSGPSYTSLLDPEFPEKLAKYARTVARRYPWVERFTPINEPLTTARFSALYGHWYPHQRSDHAFARALVNQVWGIVRSMQEIRREVPHAQLIHTEDLGFVRSTDDLAYQADFENERRFLGLDLLYGRVDRKHGFHRYLRSAGIGDRELGRFRENPLVPQVLGFNYYVTGERFLDSRVDRYPPRVIGGNGAGRYADVEAVRVCDSGLIGPGPLLTEAFRRFQTPVAVTEAHLGGPPEERARWFSYVWHAAETVRALGIPVRAVTAWALLGSYGWDRLVTDGACSYEAGAFQVRDDALVETPYAAFLRALARGAPCLSEGGWWRHPERLLYREAAAERRAQIGTSARVSRKAT
jgi:dTDP-4-dehydrorhamnose reductase